MSLEYARDFRVGGAWTIHFGPSREQLPRHRHVFIAIDRLEQHLHGLANRPT